ncbi:major facilitator superfamily [Sporothrix schenckii 1099-18]|uniref:Major facilitator superfamily n=1 Tax=Sporothrix schenckii 1099-18 TaxID=1397361 RepID=A0A0F2LVV7_SPOSC|nr:major facilitator superfamily [Sporothrix schenckii 1099-18]KJR81588.1 major facilitator superfamily [Sporothrix schenckii 1099-18]
MAEPIQHAPVDVNTDTDRLDLEKGDIASEPVVSSPNALTPNGVLQDLAATPPRPPPYHVYSRNEKWVMVGLVAVTGLYSPLPANIYFPALPTLAKVFHVSTEAMNQTVTAYLLMQGVSPMLWGTLSDRYGRRPVFLVCLTILIASCIGLALCPTSAFWLLIVLRLLQAAGCASTIALGAGVIGDISTPEERGGYFGYFNLGPMLAPCIGPAIGGVLSQQLGWRSIFWFLVVMAAVCLLLVILFLPETMRSIAGNGSVALTGVYRPLVPVVGRHGQTVPRNHPPTPASARKVSANPFGIFLYPDISMTLFFTGVVYSINYTVTATISSSFATIYPFLDETSIGLCYLATGGGMIFGSTTTGKFLDWDFARVKKTFPPESLANPADFPREYARLRTMPIHLVVFTAAVFGWGFCLEYRAHIAVALVLQFVLGWTSISILNTTMTLMIDVLQSRSSSATACTNLVRCLLATVLVAVIDRMTNTLSYRWTYVFWGLVSASMLALMYAEIKIGSKWRRAREIAAQKEVDGE